MPSFQDARFVPHSPQQMFDLVADVERYPEFLPLCERLRIIRRSVGDEGIETLIADMAVGYKAIRENFTTKVVLDRAKLRIGAHYIDGPFRFLENHWSFEPQGEGCRIGFSIAYEFRNRALGMVMGAVFDKAFRKFSNAFEERANVIYKNSRSLA